MINIIISLDYEVFGEGHGSVKEDICEPTGRILDICDRHRVPLTIMFEVCEYLKFEEFDPQLVKRFAYSPSEMMRSQVRTAFKNGHDVQLHIHPRWVGARYSDDKWFLNAAVRDIGDLSEDMICRTLRTGKEKLVSMLKDIAPDYTCNTTRFTGHDWVEAPVKTHGALEKLDIRAHSLADYCPEGNKKGYWPLSRSGKVFEIPIHSVGLPKYRMFTGGRIISALYKCYKTRSLYLKEKVHSEIIRSKHGFLSGLFMDTYKQKWDFCKQSSEEMISFLDAGLQRYDHENNNVPLVMIGHSKDFLTAGQLERFLDIVAKKYLPSGNVRFTTFREFVESNLT